MKFNTLSFKTLNFKLYLLSILFCLYKPIKSNAQYQYFYTGKDYGSESYLSPLTQILNGGMDMLQTTNYDNTIKQLELAQGFKTFFRSVTHPKAAIERIGFKKFADSELIPFGFSKTTSQWIPNYGLHLLGGGMEYARMTDYYSYHNFKNPRLWAALTQITEQALNESVEMRGQKQLSFATVADFYFFNLPGMVLFSFENVQKLFSGPVKLTSWLGQASYSPVYHSIRNTGQYYTIKIQPDFIGPISFLYYMGAGWLSGLGVDYKGITYSLAYGNKTEEVYIVDKENDIEYIKLTPSVAFFIDKNNSLLLSLVVTTHKVYQENIRLDIYPGVLKFKKYSIGVWTNLSFEHESFMGITFKGIPGIAF